VANGRRVAGGWQASAGSSREGATAGAGGARLAGEGADVEFGGALLAKLGERSSLHALADEVERALEVAAGAAGAVLHHDLRDAGLRGLGKASDHLRHDGHRPPAKDLEAFAGERRLGELPALGLVGIIIREEHHADTVSVQKAVRTCCAAQRAVAPGQRRWADAHDLRPWAFTRDRLFGDTSHARGESRTERSGPCTD